MDAAATTSTASLRSEMYRILGWYGFRDDRIDVAHPNDLDDYPPELVATHESTHVLLSRSSLYGNLIAYVVLVSDNAEREHVPQPLPNHSELIDILIRGCFSVQEGLACFKELLHCATTYPTHYARRVAELPLDYANSLKLITAALGNCDSFTSGHEIAICRAVASTLARCAMDSPTLVFFSDPGNLSPGNLDNYLGSNSPNDRFALICNTIANRNQGRQVLQFWSSYAFETAKHLGVPVNVKNGLASYFSGPQEQIDAVEMAVQPPFLARMAAEGYLSFPWIATLADRANRANQITEGWSLWFQRRGTPALFPYSNARIMGPTNSDALIRRNYHARVHVDSTEAQKFESISTAQLAALVRETLADGRMPLVSFERTADNALLVTIWTLNIPDSTSEQIQLVHNPVLAQLDREVLKEFVYLHSALYGALWHYDAELLNKFGYFPSVGPSGHTLFTFDELSLRHVKQRVDALKKQRYTLMVFLLAFHETPSTFLIVHPHPSTFSTCWPGDRVSIQALREHYAGDDEVIFGSETATERFGEVFDLRVLHTMVSVAYR